MAFTKNRKKYICASDDHGRYEVSKFDKNLDFYGFGPWFLDHNKHNKVKIYFFLLILCIFSENEKRNTSTMFFIHIFAFKVAISFSESIFALKGPKFGPQYLGNELEYWEKKLPGTKCHHLVQNNWKRRKFEDVTPSLTLFCLDFSEND